MREYFKGDGKRVSGGDSIGTMLSPPETRFYPPTKTPASEGPAVRCC